MTNIATMAVGQINSLIGGRLRVGTFEHCEQPDEIRVYQLAADLLVKHATANSGYYYKVYWAVKYADEFFYCRALTVFFGKDKLGYIDTYTGALTFRDNPRLRKTRSGSKKTTKLGAALKIMREYFMPFDLVTKRTDERHRMSNIANTMRSENVMLQNGLARRLLTNMSPILDGKSEQFREFVESCGCPSEWVSDLCQMHERCTAHVATLAHTNYLHIDGDFYIVVDTGDRCLDTFTSDTLPNKLAEKLGMMKLSGSLVIVNGAGVKMTDTDFILSGDYK